MIVNVVNIATGPRRWLGIRKNVCIIFSHISYSFPMSLYTHEDQVTPYLIQASTFCRITWRGGNNEGYSHCSIADPYNKIFGEKLALKRAMKQAKFSRAQRRLIWQEYFKRQ